MYRSRLGGRLGKEAMDYVSSVDADAEIAEYDILGSIAHVRMLSKCKIIPAKDAAKILSALRSLQGKKIVPDEGSEDIHELVESLVAKKAGKEAGGKMQTGRSRNDQVSLDMRLKIRDDINSMSEGILDLVGTMLKMAALHQKTVMPLYTHLQQAQVGTLSHYLIAHADAVLRDFDRLSSAYARVNKSPLGAGPVGGTGLPIDRMMTARLLGFDGLVENSLDATSSRDFASEYVAAVSILMGNLSRMAEDLIIWASAEFSFITLSDTVSSPSSAMPQKKNPDLLELTRGKAAVVIGNLTGILSAIKGMPSGYGRDMQEIKPLVWSCSRTGIGALVIVRSVLQNITVNDAAMRKAAGQKSYLAAMDVAERLVMRGVPFRDAHRMVGSLVNRAHAQKIPLSEIGQEDADKAAGSAYDSRALLGMLQDANELESLRARKSAGSASAASQKRMLSKRRALMASRQAALRARIKASSVRAR